MHSEGSETIQTGKSTIGIVLALTPEDHDFQPQPAYRFEYLKQHYYEALERAGALAVAIPATERLESIPDYCNLLDGLLLVGGEDIHPQLYGEPLDPRCRPQMPRRDQFEAILLQEAHRLKIPVFGICRGMQLMNIAFGGTLHQDLSLQPDAGNHGQQGENDFATSHTVEIVPGTLLHAIVGRSTITTNTSHHQGVKSLGKSLRVSARATDGVIEAIEGEGFTLGVQWHPEAWSYDETSRRLFESFVAAADNHRQENRGS